MMRSSGLLEHCLRSASHCIEYMRGVTSATTQDGHMTVHDNIVVTGGIHWCTGAGCGIQWQVEECADTLWYAITHDAEQWALGALPPKRHMDRRSRCTMGCNSPRIDEDLIEHLEMPCLAETGLRGCYQQIQGRESVIWRITLEHSGRLLVTPFGTYIPIILQCCLW